MQTNYLSNGYSLVVAILQRYNTLAHLADRNVTAEPG